MRRRQALLGAAILGVTIAAALVPASALASTCALKQETIPAAGVAVKVPAGWISATPSAALSAEHVVATYRAPSAASGFRDNLTVIVGSVPRGVTLRGWLLGRQATRYLSLGSLKAVRIHGTSGLAYTSSKLKSFHGKPLQIAEYGFLHGGNGYLFTYISLRNSLALFEDSARSIRFLLGPPVA